jgi:hypothetical protein
MTLVSSRHLSSGIIFLQRVATVCNKKMFLNYQRSLKISRIIFNNCWKIILKLCVNRIVFLDFNGILKHCSLKHFY